MVDEPIWLNSVDVNVAGADLSVFWELYDQMWVEGVVWITADVRAVCGKQAAHMVVLRDQVQRRPIAKLAHGDGCAHRRTAECDVFLESTGESFKQCGIDDKSFSSFRGFHEAENRDYQVALGTNVKARTQLIVADAVVDDEIFDYSSVPDDFVVDIVAKAQGDLFAHAADSLKPADVTPFTDILRFAYS